VPEALAAARYGDGQVSVVGVQALPGGGCRDLLVEKDFTCLVPGPGEDQSDYFANRAKSVAKTPIGA
jgi:hypothetical protein